MKGSCPSILEQTRDKRNGSTSPPGQSACSMKSKVVETCGSKICKGGDGGGGKNGDSLSAEGANVGGAPILCGGSGGDSPEIVASSAADEIPLGGDGADTVGKDWVAQGVVSDGPLVHDGIVLRGSRMAEPVVTASIHREGPEVSLKPINQQGKVAGLALFTSSGISSAAVRKEVR